MSLSSMRQPISPGGTPVCQNASITRERNLATVTAMYLAFGVGDIAAVWDHLDQRVEWSNRGPEEIPNFGVKHGHEGALAVFGFLGENVDITLFEPHNDGRRRPRCCAGTSCRHSQIESNELRRGDRPRV